jgi:hypothetical protein
MRGKPPTARALGYTPKQVIPGSTRLQKSRMAKGLPFCASAIRFFKSRGPGDFKIDFQIGGGPIWRARTHPAPG